MKDAIMTGAGLAAWLGLMYLYGRCSYWLGKIDQYNADKAAFTRKWNELRFGLRKEAAK